MCSAATEVARQRLFRLFQCRIRRTYEQRSRGHYAAARAVAALCRLFGDERRLHTIRLLRRAQPFDCRDAASGDAARRHHARPHRLIVEEHRTRAALSQHAAGLGAGEPKRAAERVQKRLVWVPTVQGRDSTVDPAGIGRHGLTDLTRSRRAERSHTPSRRSYTVTADGQRFVINSILVPLEPWR